MNAPRLCSAVLVCVLAALGLASTASAQQCPQGAQCSRVTVPLDHSGRQSWQVGGRCN